MYDDLGFYKYTKERQVANSLLEGIAERIEGKRIEEKFPWDVLFWATKIACLVPDEDTELWGELRECLHCAVQAKRIRNPIVIGRGVDHEWSKWNYLSSLRAHRAVMILASRIEERGNAIIKSVTKVTDWNVAPSILQYAFEAATK